MDMAYRSEMNDKTEYLDIDIIGRTGRIKLNRPKALHALTTAMCHQIRKTLETWWHDQAVMQVSYARLKDGHSVLVVIFVKRYR